VGLINQAPTTNNNHGGFDESNPYKNQGGIDESNPYKNLGGFKKSNYDADLPF